MNVSNSKTKLRTGHNQDLVRGLFSLRKIYFFNRWNIFLILILISVVFDCLVVTGNSVNLLGRNPAYFIELGVIFVMSNLLFHTLGDSGVLYGFILTIVATVAEFQFHATHHVTAPIWFYVAFSAVYLLGYKCARKLDTKKPTDSVTRINNSTQ